jgi:hypothetical protein
VPDGKGDKLIKKSAILAVLLYIAGTVSGQEFTFRGHHWGDSLESVIDIEGTPNYKSDIQLIYQNRNVAGYNAALFFLFSLPQTQSGLTSGRYVLPVTNVNSQVVYNDLLSKLSALYGTPTQETKPYLSASDRYNYWVVSRTLISLSLLVDLKMGDMQGTVIYIDYRSPQSSLNNFGEL